MPDRTWEGLARAQQRTIEIMERRLRGAGGVGLVSETTSDWNTATQPGFYASSNALGGALNVPFNSTWTGQVFVDTNGNIFQKLQQTTTLKNEWIRTRTGVSTWSAWERTDGLRIPSSVTGGTYEPVTGRIHLATGSKTWDIQGVFDPDYRAYIIRGHWYTPGTTGAQFYLSVAGVPNDTTNYNVQTIHVQGSGTPSTSNGIVSVGTYPAFAASGTFFDIEVREPATVVYNNNQKRIRGRWGSFGSPSLTYTEGSLGGYDTTAFDGFRIRFSDQSQAGITAAAGSWITVEAVA